MLKLNYFDLVGRVAQRHPPRVLAAAVEELSRAYREGRPAEHDRSPAARAAYLVHVLPAHVCDQRSLWCGPLADLLARPRLSVLALGGGPGTEVLSLADALARRRLAGEPAPAALEVLRVDRFPTWDDAFAPLFRAFLARAPELDPELGTAWTLAAPPATLVADLAGPPPPALLAAAATADLVLVPNLLTELVPRATPALPPGAEAGLQALAAALPAGADVVILDRAHAPGAPARVEAARAALARARPFALDQPPRTSEGRCACLLTRAVKELYARVKLETTKREDRPILTLRTLWTRVRLGPVVA